MWRNVGITRSAQPLAECQEIIKFWQRYVMDKIFDLPQGWECQNMLTICLLIAKSSQIREESRGVHFRRDFPDINDNIFKKHIEVSKQL
jgi:L-aspartate oxidase